MKNFTVIFYIRFTILCLQTYFMSSRICSISFFLIVFLLYSSVGIDAQDIFISSHEETLSSFPQSWIPVSDNVKNETLKMLILQMEGNYKKIQTYQAEALVQYEEGITENFAQEINIPDRHIGKNLVSKTEYFAAIYADIVLGKTSRVKQIKQHEITRDGKKINLQNIRVSNRCSILSDVEYLYSYDEKILSGIPELIDFPEIKNKMIAWRESPENAKILSLVEMIDFCEYYNNDCWGNIEFILNSLNDKSDSKDKFTLDKLYLFESIDDKGLKWFRLSQELSSGINKDDKISFNVFWSQEYDFLPTLRLCTDKANKIKDLIQVHWKKTGSVFFPNETLDTVYESSGKLSYRRKMILDNIEINKPIDPKHFSYSVLGLSDGDILVDRIKQQVFTIQNDKPVYLAKFYEKYQTPHERSINRVRMFMIILGFTLIVLGLYLKIRRKRSENTPK